MTDPQIYFLTKLFSVLTISSLACIAGGICARRKNFVRPYYFLCFMFPPFLIIQELRRARPDSSLLNVSANGEPQPKLIDCPVCGNKMSSQAKACPSCGNKNNIISKKRPGIIEWIGIFCVFSPILFGVATEFSTGEIEDFDANGYPSCGSDYSRNEVESTYKTIPINKISGIHIISWTDSYSIGETPEKLTCKAHVLLSSTDRVELLYNYHHENGQLLIYVSELPH